MLGNQLSRRGFEAIASRTEQVEAFILFADALDKALVKKWTTMAQAWEEDKKKPNPYMPSKTGM